MADIDLSAANYPKYATVLNGSIAKLGDGASTVGATLLGVDGIAADAKVCYTAGAYGGIIESLIININDTVAVNVLVYIVEGGVVNPLGIVNIPISSGSLGTVPAVDALNGTGICLNGLPFNSVFKKYIPMKPNATLKVAVLAAMTANKILFAKTTGTDYII